MIAASKPGVLVGSGQQGVDFRATQEMDQSSSVSFSGYSEHALDLRGMGRLFVRGVLKEGADGGQPQIAAAGRNWGPLGQRTPKIEIPAEHRAGSTRITSASAIRDSPV